MELRPYGPQDLALTEAIETDPAMMKDLGGPWPRESVAETHRKRLKFAREGGWWFVIVPDASGEAAGTIGVWEIAERGEAEHEMGWMILPKYQGRGLAGEAGRAVLERARAEKRFRRVSAFPAVSNAASNALCRKLGFSRIGPRDIDYGGRSLKCVQWSLDL